MTTVLLTECSAEITEVITEVLGEKVKIEAKPFAENMALNYYTMVILQARADGDDVMVQLTNMRYACNFRDIPIVLIKNPEDSTPAQRFISAGATDVLAIETMQEKLSQTLQRYLNAMRQPLEREIKYLLPFIEGTQNVFQTMAAIRVKLQEVYFQREPRIFGDVSGVIGLSGEANGMVVVTFYLELARQIVSKLLGTPEEELDVELINDGVGEIINMVSGYAKTALSDTQYRFNLSLPTVVVGRGHEVGFPQDVSIATMVFDIDEHSFALKLCLAAKQND